ncbi:MAG: Secretion protein HlyD, partial [Proteobacteria bacterium]|nr:Secretion protein HlyD [Pseudomonadota bacterium]
KARSDFEAAAAGRTAASATQSHALIVAPINGVVARRHLELGEMAAPGRPLFTLYAPGGLRVKANVPQYRLPEMRGVKTAKIEFPELKLWVEATEVQVLPTVDASTKTAEVRVGLPTTPEHLTQIMPGMFARVHFVIGEVRKMTVPTQAVVRRGEVAGVYVQAADGRLSMRQIRLGETIGSATEVLAGLTTGEKVVTDPVKAAIQLKAGK